MKSVLLRLVSAAILSCSANWALADGVSQFRQFLSSTKSARGEFSQVLLQAKGESQARGKTSTGNFLFARPGKFIWTYQKPYAQVLQSDGDKLYIWDKDLAQVSVRKLGEVLTASPAAILFGSNDVDKNFSVKDGGAKDGLEWLELTPRSADKSFQTIQIGFAQGLPQQMLLRDAFGQLTRLQFSRFEKNPALDAAQFSFQMPAGVDVLQQ
ncbi:outer membrane lipoprotein chaperone LolA [Massilia sp. W12]|uniref:outer membrane lipoprotein chaperone LolA n=1 Tax=Massilia sp. W12 TaxID=3126507 RepID=UPI0030D5D033